jgi:ATP-binding cassette subfamily B (MDR/TAP) protein 1
VFNRFSLHIPAGKTTAVIGASGSGKSTLVALLMRFYLPAKGTILVDGHGIDQLNVRWWRQQVALVSQEPVLFNATIFDNIAYGLKGAEHRKVRTPHYPVMNRDSKTDMPSS